MRSNYLIFSWLLCMLCCYNKNMEIIYLIIKPTYVLNQDSSFLPSPLIKPHFYDYLSANKTQGACGDTSITDRGSVVAFNNQMCKDASIITYDHMWDADLTGNNRVPAATYDFISTNVTEAFYATLQAALVVSFLFTVPLLVYHFWCFLIPSRYFRERKSINHNCILSCIYMCVCFWLITYNLVPHIGQFLRAFAVAGGKLRIVNQARIAPYLSWLCSTITTLFLATLFPLLTYYGLKKHWIGLEFLLNNRKIYMYFLLVLGALVSPPDLLTQFVISFCLFITLEFVIWIYLYKSLENRFI